MWYNLNDDSNYSNVFVVQRNIGYQSSTFLIIKSIIHSSWFLKTKLVEPIVPVHCQDVSRVHTSLGISLQFECYSKERDGRQTQVCGKL